MRYLYWISIVVVSVGTATVVYGPHALQGNTSVASFPPRRIVSLTLAADEMLLALTTPARIAALTRLASDPRFSNVVTEAHAVPRKVWGNAEQVLVLQPDLVIVAAYTNATAKGLLRDAGIPLLELGRYDSLADVKDHLLTVGRAIGELDRAHLGTLSHHIVKGVEAMARALHPRVFSSTAGRRG
jgi:ABC-type Fe3+-hydroxamate transport system substrate-binding protein